jgi:hypothetical protein
LSCRKKAYLHHRCLSPSGTKSPSISSSSTIDKTNLWKWESSQNFACLPARFNSFVQLSRRTPQKRVWHFRSWNLFVTMEKLSRNALIQSHLRTHAQKSALHQNPGAQSDPWTLECTEGNKSIQIIHETSF